MPDEPCETPTLSAVMSEQGVADCAFEMRNGVKWHAFACRVIGHEPRRKKRHNVLFYTGEDLHLFSFKTPTLWAVMSGEGVAYCASSMRNGVKHYTAGVLCFQIVTDTAKLTN